MTEGSRAANWSISRASLACALRRCWVDNMLIPLQRFAASVVVLWQGEITPEQFQSGRSLLWMFVQTIFALGFVCLLAYVVLRVVLPRLNFATAGKSMVNVIDRTQLEP